MAGFDEPQKIVTGLQLLQAGVKVVKVLDASQQIGGYKVHASKLRRLGVEIDVKTSIKKAIGTDYLERIEIAKLDENWEFIDGTEEVELSTGHVFKVATLASIILLKLIFNSKKGLFLEYCMSPSLTR